jgi:prepilin-type N-terminal cleavage/methylation domain-containing protein
VILNYSRMKRILAQGFTLVELLIVIALLGVIATIVIAAINPIEQANKARDAGYKNDASELVSAVQRYYASQSNFPWTTVNVANTADIKFGWVSADDISVGLCAATGTACRSAASPAPLIGSYEVETSFLSKAWIGAAGVGDKLYIGKATGSSSGVYVCWVPRANSNRQALITGCTGTTPDCKMANLAATGGFAGAGTPVYAEGCTTPGDANWAPTSGFPTCAECVPE